MSIANVYHDKIRGPGHKRNFHFGKLFVQISAAFIDHPLCFVQMFVIFECRERADLSNAVHIKWLPCFVQYLDQISRPNRIPNAQAGESVNFRKRAQDNNVSSFANELQRIRRTIEEFEISLIENDHYVFSDARHEIVYGPLRKQRPGWIIWVGDEDQPGFWRD